MKKERKFNLGQRVMNIQTKESGEVIAFENDPEVYGIKTDYGYRIWGELDMVPEDSVAK
jgi:hypothetical protein